MRVRDCACARLCVCACAYCEARLCVCVRARVCVLRLCDDAGPQRLRAAGVGARGLGHVTRATHGTTRGAPARIRLEHVARAASQSRRRDSGGASARMRAAAPLHPRDTERCRARRRSRHCGRLGSPGPGTRRRRTGTRPAAACPPPPCCSTCSAPPRSCTCPHALLSASIKGADRPTKRADYAHVIRVRGAGPAGRVQRAGSLHRGLACAVGVCACARAFAPGSCMGVRVCARVRVCMCVRVRRGVCVGGARVLR